MFTTLRYTVYTVQCIVYTRMWILNVCNVQAIQFTSASSGDLMRPNNRRLLTGLSCWLSISSDVLRMIEAESLFEH